MSLSHKTLRCVDPAARALSVTVGEESFASAGGILPPEGTLYSSQAFKTFFGKDYLKEFDGFVYIGQGEDTKSGGTLLFAINKTLAQANTPFRSTPRFGNHFWHPVLLDLKFIPVQGFPISNGLGASAQRYMVREVYIPSVNEGSRFVKDEFLSPVPFLIGKYPTPQPSSVKYDFIQKEGGFPECLHKNLDITALIGQGVQGLPGQFFPATNFTDWAPYVLSDEQELTNGGYHRIRIRVYPPAAPRKIKTVEH